MRKSLWSPDEDEKLRQYVAKHGCGNWSDVAKHTGLHRCGKSCRLRWINYLRPDLKRGPFTAHEVRLVVNLHNNLGNSWSKIAAHLPGRTDNDVKNFWHSYTRSRRLQQQQRQRIDQGLAHGNNSYIATEGKPCYDSVDLYNPRTISGVKMKSREDVDELGYAEHHHIELQQPPPLMFPSSNNISKGAVLECKAPSINVDNAPSFPFGIDNHKQLPYSPAPNNKNCSNHLPHYPSALLPPLSELKTTGFKPIMIHNHLENASECSTAAIYKGIQSHLTPSQTNRSKLGSVLRASSFDHSTSSLDASASSAMSSTSHIDSQKSFDLQVYNAADHEWSSMVLSPSMQVNYSINSHGLSDDVPASSFGQANSDMDSKPPVDGLQSVIWRFLNQQDADHPATATSATPDQQRAQDHHQHFPYHIYPKPNSVAINPFSLGPETTNIQAPPIQLPLADQPLNMEEAFSSSANLQYLQAQLAADCFS
ncbi:hypothetical protein L7F22_007133 [Adiantum nelumboides]|nr:hypothetical protein [Adiantum nelumboides]